LTDRSFALALAFLALTCAACSGNDSPGASTGRFRLGTKPAVRLEPGALSVKRGRVLAPVALAGRYLVFMSGELEAEEVSPSLVGKSLGSARATTLARDVIPNFGVAAAAGWAVYATGGKPGKPPRLVAVKTDGTDRQVLTDSLIAPIASRGTAVAWAEQDGDRQRVVARDLATGSDWIAADIPRCSGGCFRIDAVALADKGVVFTRGAIGAQPSYVVRRGFSEPKAQRLTVPNDPQPDLVPSSAGALYYVLSRGWYRWDFGERQPRLTRYTGAAPPQVLGFERDRWFVLRGGACAQRLLVLGTDGRTLTTTSPPAVSALAGAAKGDCVTLADLVWTGRQSLTSWFVVPPESEEHHENAGLVGVLVGGRTLAR
jgi:hypothetical protein